MKSPDGGGFMPFFIISGQHPPFACGDIFGSVKRKCGEIADTANFFAVIPGFGGVGGVFNDGKPVFFGNFSDGVHICRFAVKMDRDNGFGFFSDGFFDSGRIYIPSF